MNRLNIVPLVVLALLLATAPLRADAPSAKEQALTRELVALKSQVEALRAEIKALKTMVQALSDRQVIPYAELRFAPEAAPANPVVPPSVPQDGMPDGTVRKPFNGSTLYIIPLANDPPGTPKR